MGSQELNDDRTLDRRRPQGHPRRRQVHGHDQEAVRHDRRRVDRGEPPGVPEPALHAPGIEEYVGGVILYDETIRQAARRRDAVPGAPRGKGVVPGIKVDTGAQELAGHSGREGDGGPRRAPRRLEEYHGSAPASASGAP